MRVCMRALITGARCGAGGGCTRSSMKSATMECGKITFEMLIVFMKHWQSSRKSVMRSVYLVHAT